MHYFAKAGLEILILNSLTPDAGIVGVNHHAQIIGLNLYSNYISLV